MGTEIDESEGDLEDEAANHAVERHTKTDVDLLKPAGGRQGTVTSESPDTAGGCGGASSTAKDSKNNKRAGEDESTGFAANCGAEDDGHRLCVRVVKEGADVGENKGQGHQEDEADDEIHDGGADHGLGNLSVRALDFLRHGDNHAGGGVGVGSVEDTDDPRPARSPARVRLESGEDVASAAAAFFGDGKNGADDGDDTDKGQVHSSGL